MKRKLFWMISRVCFTLYPIFPIFGSLRASVAVVFRDGKFLIIQRNDGRGLSLPGGISNHRETQEGTLQREVHEETGLDVVSSSLSMQYHSKADVPCNIFVYEAEVSGDLKDSWEGSPRWMKIEEFQPQLLKSQQPVINLMYRILQRSSG